MILCIGEILADMIGNSENGIMKFERYAGGAPFNVAVGIANLGVKTGFIGSVGNDITGRFLLDFAKKTSLDYIDINLDNKHNTTLAFVANDETGERTFQFNRFNTADYYFNYDSLNKISDADIIVLGSLMLSEAEGVHAADRVVKLAKENNKLLSFDVNYRDDIYESEASAKKISLKYVKEANIVKFSEEEINLLSNSDDIDLGVKNITNDNQLVLVTLGSKGSCYYYKGVKKIVPTIKIKAVDTTGAGDAFYAGVLAGISEIGFNNLTDDILENILRKANICGAMACMKKGAISSLPTKRELDNYSKKI